MLSHVKSFALSGIDGYPVSAEIDIRPGLPGFEIVGFADKVVKESRERVRSAIKNCGFEFPAEKILVNLAPSDTKKEGTLFDLAISLGVLAASGQLKSGSETAKPRPLCDFAVVGALSLDGSVKAVGGLLPILISARALGQTKFLIPAENAAEAAYLSGIECHPIGDLRECVKFLRGETAVKPVTLRNADLSRGEGRGDDFCFVSGQPAARRAAEISAAGGHNLLLIGPPGSGKTMIAKCIPSVLPDMTFEEALEVTKIHSVAGTLDLSRGIVTDRPFRTPHHTASRVSFIGGGKSAKPGEISLAHHGVLFLDEFPEYPRGSLETLRQPLEDGKISVTRTSASADYPAEFMLVASMNPCPCGNFGSSKTPCKCTPNEIRKYRGRLSGPLLDRIDIHVEADGVEYEDLRSPQLSESSSEIRFRVNRARKLQQERFRGLVSCNARMSPAMLRKFCTLGSEAETLLSAAFESLHLSARAYSRVLKVARTIADLAGEAEIGSTHVAEALQYRILDRKYF